MNIEIKENAAHCPSVGADVGQQLSSGNLRTKTGSHITLTLQR